MWQMVEAFGALAAALFTGGGLIAVAMQMQAAKKSMRAQFITNLEQNFASHYEIYSILEYKKDPKEIDAGRQRLSEVEIRDIMRFMGFFENLKLIIDDGVVAMGTVDKLFSYRFFMTVNDPYIQDQILYAPQYKNFLPAIFALHHQWAAYRRRKKLPVPFAEYDLKAANPSLYREELTAYGR